MKIEVGTRLGEYEVIEPIGSGGMGSVYLARHVHMGKKYAVKVLPESLASDNNFVARFRDEARVMADLRHPRIVQVQYMGIHQGSYFLAMDYVIGPSGKPESLRDRLRNQPEGRMPEDQTLTWAIQIAKALAYAHECGVAHRDIKPGNILIDTDNEVLLTDFGLAKAVGNEFILSQIHESMNQSLGAQATRSGGKPDAMDDTLDIAATIPADTPPGSGSDKDGRSSGSSGILGTYDYMAPEQRGEGTRQIDQRTDIYAFGVLLYRMLTGRRPVGRSKSPSEIARVCPGWDKVVNRCMEYAPVDRYPSVEALLEDLYAVGDDTSLGAELLDHIDIEEPAASDTLPTLHEVSSGCTGAHELVSDAHRAKEGSQQAGVRLSGDWREDVQLAEHELRTGRFEKAFAVSNTLWLAERRGDYPDFEEDYDEVVARIRGVWQQVATARPEWPELLIALGQLVGGAEGRRWLEKATTIAPNSARAWAALASWCVGHRRPRRATECYRKALEHDPDNPELWLSLAAELRENGQDDEMHVCLRRALEVAPADWDFHKRLAEAWGCNEEALPAYHRAISFAEQSGVDRIDIGMLYGDLGRHLAWTRKRGEAEDALRKAIALIPEDEMLHAELIMLLYEQKRKRKAAYEAASEAVTAIAAGAHCSKSEAIEQVRECLYSDEFDENHEIMKFLDSLEESHLGVKAASNSVPESQLAAPQAMIEKSAPERSKKEPKTTKWEWFLGIVLAAAIMLAMFIIPFIIRFIIWLLIEIWAWFN